MEHCSRQFIAASREAIGNQRLHDNLGLLTAFLPAVRSAAIADVSNFEELRNHLISIKDHALDHLSEYLEQFETQLTGAGGKVHWARDAAELNSIVSGLCMAAGARKIVKGKSMVGEETSLNDSLLAAGMEVVETDLGEYIIQLAKEPPSHILGPALHRSKEEVAELFHQHHRLGERNLEAIDSIVAEARMVLRQRFLDADVGITGANCLIAETGTTMLVTNEGNGDLCSTLPRLHIVIAGIEKVVPRLEDATALNRVLTRSATGQTISTYTSFHCGPRRGGDSDGPKEFHVILLDNGRSDMLAGPYRSMLRCIRCASCLNHCPVYRHVGGHAFGWVYPGPMGSVLTPLLSGLDQAPDLPNACTACGRCEEVCPVSIPLPEHLRQLRNDMREQGHAPKRWSLPMRLAMTALRLPWLYRVLSRIAVPVLRILSRHPAVLRYMPLASGWVEGRSLPPPQGSSFLADWQKRHRGRA